MIPKVGPGMCKRASTCKWLIKNEIPENDWKICRYHDINPLVCCQDPIIESRQIDCAMKIFNFHSAQICFGSNMKELMEMMKNDTFVDVVENFVKEHISNDIGEVMNVKVDFQRKLLDEVKFGEDEVQNIKEHEPQRRSFYVVRQPAFGFGYITFIVENY